LPVDGDRLLVEVAEGEGAQGERGRLIDRAGSPLGDVLTQGEARVMAASDLPATAAPGDGLAVPMGGADGEARGVLVVTGLPGPDTAVATRALSSFAAQAAVALELAERRRDAERYAVFEDRDRIARDLHDLVIQRLFATGMHLEGAVRLIDTRPAEASTRVRHAVDDLDATIRELRSTIYGLQAPADEHSSLRALILQVVDAGAEQLGFAPSLRMDGLVDTLVPVAAAEHLLAALREALSNAARHASASTVDVRVAVRDDELLLEVADDGVGMGDTTRRSGLGNLAGRAAQLGGTLHVESGPGTGVRVTWRVPLGSG
jgi:signal transduction histidine kinase